ncbi:hypothetical protein AAC387_Pa06g1150 [Persea americana]
MSKTHDKTTQEDVLLFPFMAQGHLFPFIALARLLEQHTPYTITIINTPLNIKQLRSHLPLNTTIQLSELPFNAPDHGLPPNCENTNTVPPHLALRFIQSSQSLQSAFDRLLSAICGGGRRPLCIIADEFMAWTVESARKFGVFHCILQTTGAYGAAIVISLWTHLPHRKADAGEEFSLPGLPDVKLHRSQIMEEVRDIDGTDPWSILLRKCIYFSGQSDGVLVNTVEEMESKALSHLRKNSWRRAWAIGPLLSPPFTPSTTSSCVEWLSLQPPDSVLYISFGSQSSIDLSPMMELAKGLEASGKHFIWVIRPPSGFDPDEEFRAEWLPEGFEERITERKQGILVKKWAPQMEILSHESTGAFLSHCGWNSVLESLSEGVPIIGWPIGAEQPYNSKLLEEELGVAVEVARGRDAEISWVEVAEVLGWVMDGESEKGMEIRRKMKRTQELMKSATSAEEGRGSSVRAIEDFIQTALAFRDNS